MADSKTTDPLDMPLPCDHPLLSLSSQERGVCANCDYARELVRRRFYESRGRPWMGACSVYGFFGSGGG